MIDLVATVIVVVVGIAIVVVVVATAIVGVVVVTAIVVVGLATVAVTAMLDRRGTVANPEALLAGVVDHHLLGVASQTNSSNWRRRTTGTPADDV